jgi:hypothetical protein
MVNVADVEAVSTPSLAVKVMVYSWVARNIHSMMAYA